MTEPRIVVGIEKHGADRTDAWGCYWERDEAADLWRHDYDRCEDKGGCWSRDSDLYQPASFVTARTR